MTALLLLCVVLFAAGPLKILPAVVVGVLLLGIATFVSHRIAARRSAAAIATAETATTETATTDASAPTAAVTALNRLTAADAIVPQDHLLAGLGEQRLAA